VAAFSATLVTTGKDGIVAYADSAYIKYAIAGEGYGAHLPLILTSGQ